MFGFFKRSTGPASAFPVSGSAQLAALDLYICRHIGAGWPHDTTRRVLRELREGKRPRELARATGMQLALVKRIKRASTGSVTSLFGNNRGSIAVEAAILMPIFALLVLGGLDLGVAVLYSQRLQFASESAARCRALAQCESDGATIAYARDRAGLDGATFTAASAACGAQVTGTMSLSLAPGLIPALSLTGSACYPLSPA